MRPDLCEPLVDRQRLDAAVELLGELCRLYDEEEDFSGQLARLSELVGQSMQWFNVAAAARAQDHETLVRKLLVHPSKIPANLSDSEMLELIERVRSGQGTEFHIYYWLECLWVNTGDKRISDLIQRPDVYFGELDSSREMTARGILKAALAGGKKDAETR